MISCRLILVLLAALAASAPRAADLRIGMSADVTSIDPHFVNITPNNNVAWHIFEALTHVDENVRLVPGLAESWRPVDPTIWEFRLRKGVRFSDGSELTAEDVAFSIDRPATLTTSPGPFTTFTRPIVGKEIVDRHTIRVRTATPYAMVPYDLNSVFIVSRKAAAGASTEDFNTGKSAVGTGPYKLARFARGDRVELVRNDAYSGPKPAWDRVILRVMPNDGARVTALLADDLDAIEYVPTADLKRVRSTPRFRLEQKVSWRTIFFTLDQRREPPAGVTDKGGRPLDRNPFADARVREAMAKAINRQAIVDRIMDGAAVPASNLVAPPVFGHVADLKPVAYDPNGAKKLLAEAGVPNGFRAHHPSRPTTATRTTPRSPRRSAQMLSRIGIDTQVVTMTQGVFFRDASTGSPDKGPKFSFILVGWGSGTGEASSPLKSLLASFDRDKGMGASNRGRYSNPQVDKLIDDALATVDDAKRAELLARATEVAIEDVGHHPAALPGRTPGRCAAASPTSRAPTSTRWPDGIGESRTDGFRHPAGSSRAWWCILVMSLVVFVGVHIVGDPVHILISDDMTRSRSSASSSASASTGRCASSTSTSSPTPRAATSATRSSSASRRSSSSCSACRRRSSSRSPRWCSRSCSASRWACTPASSRDRSRGRAIMAGSILGFSLPTFWVGLMLIMVFAVHARLAAVDRARRDRDAARHPVSFLTWDGLRAPRCCRRSTSRCSRSRCSSASRAPARARRCCRTT